MLVEQGKLDEALKAYRDGLAIRERLAAADRSNAEWQRDLSVSYDKVGDVLVAQGKLDEALKAYRDGLAIRERLAAADRSNTQWQRDLSISYNKVGDVLVAQGKLDEALKAYRDGLAIAERLAAADPQQYASGSAICNTASAGLAAWLTGSSWPVISSKHWKPPTRPSRSHPRRYGSTRTALMRFCFSGAWTRRGRYIFNIAARRRCRARNPGRRSFLRISLNCARRA